MNDDTAFTEYRRFATGVMLRILGVGVSVLSAVVTSRGLGVSGRGLLYTCTAASTLGAQFLSLGMPSAAVLVVASRPDLASRAIRYAMMASLAAGVLSISLAEILPSLGSSWLSGAILEYGPLVAGLIATQILLSWCSSLTQALGAVDSIPVIELLYRVTTVIWAWVALFLLVLSFKYFLASLILLDLFYGSSWLIYVARISPSSSVQSTWPSEYSLWSLRAYFPLLLEAAIRRADVLILSSLSGIRSTGLYSVATQVLDVSQIGSVFLGQKAMYAFSSGLGDSRALRWLRRAMPVGVAGGMILVGFTADAWAPWLFGSDFTGVGPIVLALCPGAVALSWQTVAAKEIAASGFPLRLTLAWLIIFCSAVALMFTLIPLYAAEGAGAALSVSYLCLAALVYGIRRRLRETASENRQNPADVG
jgi:O-antigen/teichoic acid export membrane protein